MFKKIRNTIDPTYNPEGITWSRRKSAPRVVADMSEVSKSKIPAGGSNYTHQRANNQDLPIDSIPASLFGASSDPTRFYHDDTHVTAAVLPRNQRRCCEPAALSRNQSMYTPQGQTPDAQR